MTHGCSNLRTAGQRNGAARDSSWRRRYLVPDFDLEFGARSSRQRGGSGPDGVWDVIDVLGVGFQPGKLIDFQLHPSVGGSFDVRGELHYQTLSPVWSSATA